MAIFVYDCEVYSNTFTATFKNVDTEEIKVFVIHSSRNDLDTLMAFINSYENTFVGYNSFSYDNQLLNYLYKNWAAFTFLESDQITYCLYTLSQKIIESDTKEYMYNLPFKWLDLMKILYAQKSLKLIGVSLKWKKLQELPFKPDKFISNEELEVLLKYNLNDVLITEVLYNNLKKEIELRKEISQLYDIDAYSEPRSGIANRILEKVYSETTGLDKRQFKDLRTERKRVSFNDVIYPIVNFKSIELDLFLEEIKNHIYYGDTPYFTKTLTYNGVRYKLGLGGIHSVDSPGHFEATEDTYLIDADVASEYPAAVINNQLYPAHLGSKFLKEFERLRDERIEAKHSGQKTKNEALKIVLNATVGKTLSKLSWLYDPLVNLKVTINCQLLMLMLVESLALVGIQTISANTDGILCIVPKSKLDIYYQKCKEWELLSKFELEYTKYKKYIRRDVNNYIAIKEDNKVKGKGVFLTEDCSNYNLLDTLNKGFDKPIVALAAYNFLVYNKPIKDTILNHTDIYDFCVAKKIDNKFTNIFETIENGKYIKEELQKAVRYYISTDGGILVKYDPTTNGVERYEANSKVTIYNDHIEKDIKEYNIHYGYYINEAQKMIDEIISPQLTLF